MKKLISVALATFCTVSFVGASSLEEYDKSISEAKNPTLKQILTCEREANYIYKDPQQCIKAADMVLEMSKKATKNSLLRCEFFGKSEETCKLEFPSIYQKTDKEFFNGVISESYLNAGIMYDKKMIYEKSVAMFEKAIEYGLNNIDVHYNLGLSHYYGRGIAINKHKAYYYWSIAAKQGDQQAQKKLDILCKESPWACKK